MLVEALRSVEAQSYQQYEVIVVDDGSTDETAASLAAFPWVRVIRNEVGGGAPAARNSAIAAATGDYVAFLDDDDLWFPWTLAIYVEAIRIHGSPAQVTANGTTFTQSRKLDAVGCLPPHFLNFRDYLSYATNPVQPGWLLPTGACVRRDLLTAVGGFDPGLSYFEDEDLWLKLGDVPGYVRIAEPLCWGYRSHASMSADISVRFNNIHRLLEKERQSAYPGGVGRQRERRSILAKRGRHLARLAAAQGMSHEAWRLYWGLLSWNLQLLRFKFLLLFPAEIIAGASRKRFSLSRRAKQTSAAS
jgi:glycosyltransferase involved in cell wall biosynthesis